MSVESTYGIYRKRVKSISPLADFFQLGYLNGLPEPLTSIAAPTSAWLLERAAHITATFWLADVLPGRRVAATTANRYSHMIRPAKWNAHLHVHDAIAHEHYCDRAQLDAGLVR